MRISSLTQELAPPERKFSISSQVTPITCAAGFGRAARDGFHRADVAAGHHRITGFAKQLAQPLSLCVGRLAGTRAGAAKTAMRLHG